MANGRVYVQHNGQFGWIKDPWLLIPDGVKHCGCEYADYFKEALI